MTKTRAAIAAMLLTVAMVACGLKIEFPPPAPATSPTPAPTAIPTVGPPPSPTPKPSPILEPPASPEPDPTPKPSPSPTAAPPIPVPCVETSPPAPPCMKPPECAGSCAAYVDWALKGEHLTRLPNSPLLYNDPDNNPAKRQYLDSRTCYYVNAEGAKVSSWNRLREDKEVCPDCPKPTPPTPCPPSPPPSSPTPAPSGAPPIDPATGNYPMPPDGVCPAHFADSLARVGISVEVVGCGVNLPPGTTCRKGVGNATQKSRKPYCPHAPDRLECEMWRPCQQPKYVDYLNVPENGEGGGIWMQIAHPSWPGWGRCDKRTCDDRIETCPALMTNPRHNFLCQDKAVNRSGVTRMRACMPDGTMCSETSYQTSAQ